MGEKHTIEASTSQRDSEDSQDCRVALFVSFDLCDSVDYKRNSANKDIWKDVVYRHLTQGFGGSNMHPLKHLGDEVIYFREIPDLYSIASTVYHADAHVNDLSRALNNEFGTTVFLKSTIWIARFKQYVPGVDDGTTNTRMRLLGSNDYIGTCIDEGFRLSKVARTKKDERANSNTLIIDPKIVYVLLGQLNKFKFEGISEDDAKYSKEYAGWVGKICYFANPREAAGKHSLKGISKVNDTEYYYPVFTYSNESTGVSPDIHRLKTSFENLQTYKEVSKIQDCLPFNKGEERPPDFASPARLFYTVGCLNKDCNKVLVGKRKNYDEGGVSGTWDFGIVEHRWHTDMVDFIQNRYKKTINEEIRLKFFGNPKDKIIKTIAVYCDDRESMKYSKFLLCCAKFKFNDAITSDDKLVKRINENLAKNKGVYEEVRFVDVCEAKALEEAGVAMKNLSMLVSELLS